MNDCKVIDNDVVVFIGSHSDCCAFIVSNYTPSEYDKAQPEIIYHGGRMASHVLNWSK